MSFSVDDRGVRRSLAIRGRLESTLHHSFWALLFVAFPLAVSPWAFSSGGSVEAVLLEPKAIVLALALMTGLASVLVSFPNLGLRDLPGTVRRAPPVVKLLLLFLVVLVSGSVFSDGDLAVTLLGGAGRLDGVVLQTAWYSIAVLAYVLSWTKVVRGHRVLGFLLVGGFVTAIWVILQSRGVEPLRLFVQESDLGVLPSGPLGHGAITAGYLAVVLLSYAAFICLDEQRRLSLTVLAALSLIAVGIMASGGRTGLVMVAVVWSMFALSNLRTRRVLSAVAVVTGTLFAAGILGHITKSTEQQLLYATNLGGVAEGRDASFNSRLSFWPAAVRGIIERPLFGAGPVGFNAIFWRHATVDEKMYVVRAHLSEPVDEIRLGSSSLFQVRFVGDDGFVLRSQVIDKAHNYLLDLAVSSGLPAAILFVALVYLGVSTMYRSTCAVTRGALVSVAAAAIMSMAWFPMLVLDPMVWALFGLGLGTAHVSGRGTGAKR